MHLTTWNTEVLRSVLHTFYLPYTHSTLTYAFYFASERKGLVRYLYLHKDSILIHTPKLNYLHSNERLQPWL